MLNNNNKIAALKIGFLGDSEVGKSSIFETFSGIEFYEESLLQYVLIKWIKNLI